MMSGVARFLGLLGWLLILGGCAARSSDGVVNEPMARAELGGLVAPFALYPDPLLQRVLTAATFPDQIVDAALFIERGGSPQEIPRKPWERSVQYVANYPSVLAILADDLDRTIQIGAAFTAQPDELRDCIQTLRRRAREHGNLVSSAYQTVVVEEDGSATIIRIEPTDPERIYIPTTGTAVIYERPVYDVTSVWAPAATFGLGLALAAALDHDDYYYGGPFYGPGFWYGGPVYRRWYDYRRERWHHAYDYGRPYHHDGADRAEWARHRHDLERRHTEWRHMHHGHGDRRRLGGGRPDGRASFRPPPDRHGSSTGHPSRSHGTSSGYSRGVAPPAQPHHGGAHHGAPHGHGRGRR
jgi:hypothetical protein